ncbi:aspartate--tRNA ligase [Luteolibacter sp. GHJ8]|uniref:Aspartate--tRNA(Asp/Asn) ligase n=1 Tax=Luteolibacter rhizosphaerae TaxID=2989719 RepID=A0ABT3FWP9_9BACT|nr:aspartate--tRNA ligase [Luteolibacter rhizosphaerae]MCW1911982.1 aspartate--tRNA ligase [Luteolibacter rhizosphaerae]
MRTHHCNELRSAHIGETVTLIGWVNTVRDQGGVIFVDLRDREGLTQCVFRPEESPEAAAASHKLRGEDVVQVIGKVAKRLEGTANEKLGTGEIEIVASELVVVNKADVLPFQLDKELSNEDLRMRYRYLDIRRPRLSQNLRTRHRVTKTTRDFLDEQGFCEIETPILSKSTPEGARDFLVPSRLQPGSFYALPQAPQQYKQLLMVGGMEKYFQIAKCFRDEDLRADRQPEFTQIDIEASFVGQEDIIKLVEGLMGRIFKEARGAEIPASFDRLTYREAMNTYGSDKPDRRFGMHITDLGDVFANSTFKVFSGALQSGGVVKAINAKGFSGITTGQVEALTQIAVQAGAKGLAYIQVRGETVDTWRSPITKFLQPEELEAMKAKLNVETGDLILFAAGEWEHSCDILGRVRLACAGYQNLLEGNEELNFLWVTEFPLLAKDEETGRFVAVHHPFTRPLKEDEEKLMNGELSTELRAQAYDVVLNGYELGGGSIRIHEAPLQAAMFKALGISDETAAEEFGHILDAFRFGAPPHGGLALGLDRVVMLICNEQSIREVMAFPKNNKGSDLMSQSPAEVDPKQLRDLRIQTVKKPGTAAQG